MDRQNRKFPFIDIPITINFMVRTNPDRKHRKQMYERDHSFTKTEKSKGRANKWASCAW